MRGAIKSAAPRLSRVQGVSDGVQLSIKSSPSSPAHSAGRCDVRCPNPSKSHPKSTSFVHSMFDLILEPKVAPNGALWGHFWQLLAPKINKKTMWFSNIEKVDPGSRKVAIWDPPTFNFALNTNGFSCSFENLLFHSERPLGTQKLSK